MVKSRQWRAKRQAKREAHRAEKRSAVAHSAMKAEPQTLWFIKQRPVIRPKSHEGMLAKLRRTGKLRPRPVQLYEARTKRLAKAVSK